MSDVYYIIGGVAYGIFILQFIISWVAGELDVDADKVAGISKVDAETTIARNRAREDCRN